MNPTPCFLILWIAAIVLWDVWVFCNLDPNWTVSATLLRWALARPILPLVVSVAIGILIGHLFWPQEK
jgi:hypothetical protein